MACKTLYSMPYNPFEALFDTPGKKKIAQINHSSREKKWKKKALPKKNSDKGSRSVRERCTESLESQNDRRAAQWRSLTPWEQTIWGKLIRFENEKCWSFWRRIGDFGIVMKLNSAKIPDKTLIWRIGIRKVLVGARARSQFCGRGTATRRKDWNLHPFIRHRESEGCHSMAQRWWERQDVPRVMEVSSMWFTINYIFRRSDRIWKKWVKW